MPEKTDPNNSIDVKGTLSKREFLKKSLFGICGITAASHLFPFTTTKASASQMSQKEDLSDLIKHSREALYYTPQKDNHVQCDLCPNACNLAENVRSKCRNKINIKGKLKTVVISNGYINETPLKELCKYVSAASINLKSFKESIYEKLNGGNLQPVLNSLKTYKENNVWLEIINLVIPTWTDDMTMIKEMCDWLAANGFSDTPLHFSRFTPMYKLTNIPYTLVETLEKAKKIANNSGLSFVYIGNLPGHDAENTYCPKCSKKIISRKGFTVIEKHIKNNSCEYCGKVIAGIWE